MKFFKSIFFIVLSLQIVSAQNFTRFSQYFYLSPIVNPAAMCNKGEYINVNAVYRKQWVAFPGAPTNQGINAAFNKKNTNIYGLTFLTDNIGLRKNMSIQGAWAKRYQFTDFSELTFGVSGSANIITNNLSAAALQNQNDPAFSNASSFFPNLAFGAFFRSDKFFWGLCIPELLNNKFKNGAPKLFNVNITNWHYHGQIGFDKAIGVTDWTVMPVLQMKYALGAPFQFDANAVFTYQNQFIIGAGIRTEKAVTANVGFKLSDVLQIGYAYDFTYGKLMKYVGPTHEFYLGLTIGEGGVTGPDGSGKIKRRYMTASGKRKGS